MLNLGDTTRLKKHIRALGEFPQDLHQSILDLAYQEWRLRREWQYKDMVHRTRSDYGDLAAFAVLIGKYNQQVENGGHQQYFDNGYASGIVGLGSQNSCRCALHEEMLELFQSLGFHESKVGETIFSIAKSFKIVEDDEDDEGAEDADGEDDYGFDRRPDRLIVLDSDHLDNEYYKVNDVWLKYFEQTLRLELL